MSSIHKHGKVWYLHWEEHGRRRGKSLKTGDKREAERLLKAHNDEQAAKRHAKTVTQKFREGGFNALNEYEQAILDTSINTELNDVEDSKNLTLVSLWNMWKAWAEDGNRSRNTVVSYTTAWKKLKRLRVTHARDVNAETVKNFTDLCKRDGLGRAGIMQYMISLQGIWSTAIEQKWITGPNPFKTPWQHKRGDEEEPWLDEKQLDAVVTKAVELGDANTILHVALMAYAGLRKDEGANLLWSEVNFDKKMLTIKGHKADPEKGIEEYSIKGKRIRSIPIASKLLIILAKYRADTQYLINPTKNTAKVKEGRWRYRYDMPASFYKLKDGVNVGFDWTPHTLRHSFASILVNKGVSIYKVSKWLGHASVAITEQIYAHLSKEHDEEIDVF